MTEESIPKRRPGREKGWKKDDAFHDKLPPIRVSKEMHDWLMNEKKRMGLSTLSDIMRVKLMEKMRGES